MRHVNLKLDDELYDWAKLAAKRRFMPLTAFIRQAILAQVQLEPDYKATTRAEIAIKKTTHIKKAQEAAKPKRYTKFSHELPGWFEAYARDRWWIVYKPELESFAQWLFRFDWHRFRDVMNDILWEIDETGPYYDPHKALERVFDVIDQLGDDYAFETEWREFIKPLSKPDNSPPDRTGMGAPAEPAVPAAITYKDFTPPAPPTNTRGRKIYNQLMEIKRATDQHIKPLDPDRTRNLYQALETAFADLSQPSADYAELELVVINLKEICKAGVRNLTGQEINL